METATILKATWKFLAGAIIGGAAIWVLLSWLHVKQIDRLNVAHQAELKTLSDQLTKECQNDKAITTAASQSYQAALADTRVQLDRLKRVRPAACVPVALPASRATAGHHAGTIAGNIPQQDGGGAGIDSDWLLDIAAEADDDRARLISCQKFIRETWAAKGQ